MVHPTPQRLTNPSAAELFPSDGGDVLRRRVGKACSGTWKMEKTQRDVAIMSEQAKFDSAKRKTHIQWRQMMPCRLDLAKLVRPANIQYPISL